MTHITKDVNGLPFTVVHASALDIPADSIVNAANSGLRAGSGICGAIYKAAGAEILNRYVQTRFPNGSNTGQSVITPAFGLQNHRRIIHSVGPRYDDHTPQEAAHYLTMAYSSAIYAANLVGNSVTFCGLSTGIYGYPLDEAAWVAINTVASHLYGIGSNMVVNFALFQPEEYQAFATALINCQFGGITSNA